MELLEGMPRYDDKEDEEDEEEKDKEEKDDDEKDEEEGYIMILNNTYDNNVKTRILLNQSVTNIFEYSNIRIYWSRINIRTFVCVNFSFTNIFGHSFVSNMFVRIYSDIRW